MKKPNRNYTAIPNEIINDKRLDAYEFRVLCYLCMLADEENKCFPSYTAIAQGTNISRSKVGSIIHSLAELGYINKETENKKRDRTVSNTYTICFEDNVCSLSVEDVMDKAETYNLYNEKKKHYESAIEIMFNAEAITVSGQNVPRESVRSRLENISYEHIVYVDNNMPRKLVDGKIEIQVRNPVPYIITALYNALSYTKEEIVRMEYGE